MIECLSEFNPDLLEQLSSTLSSDDSDMLERILNTEEPESDDEESDEG